MYTVQSLTKKKNKPFPFSERSDKKIGRLYQSWFRPGRLFIYICLSISQNQASLIFIDNYILITDVCIT